MADPKLIPAKWIKVETGSDSNPEDARPNTPKPLKGTTKYMEIIITLSAEDPVEVGKIALTTTRAWFARYFMKNKDEFSLVTTVSDVRCLGVLFSVAVN